MKYVRLIFGGKVLNYERQTYFQFSIYRKIIESRLEDLNRTRVTKQRKTIWMDEKIFYLSTAKVFSVHRPDSERRRVSGLKILT